MTLQGVHINCTWIFLIVIQIDGHGVLRCFWQRGTFFYMLFIPGRQIILPHLHFSIGTTMTDNIREG